MKAVLGILLFVAVLVSSCVPAPSERSPAQAEESEAEDVQMPVPAEEVPSLPEVITVPGTVLIPVEKEAVEPAVDYPFLGDENAPVTVIEYSDFSSRLNSQFYFSQVASLKRDYVQTGKVKLVVMPYALSNESSKAAEAAFCMWEQGSKQFWSYADTLHIFFSHLEASSLVNYADRAPNADKAAIKVCLDDGRYAPAVKRALESGKSEGVQEVPAVSINGDILSGDVSYSEIKSAIEVHLGEKSSASAGLASITGFVFSIPEMIYQLIG